MSLDKPTYITNEPDYRHLHDRGRFQALYNEVGEVEANKVIKWRPEWMGRFKPKYGASILELGAHNGPNLIHYGRLGHRVLGVEISDTLRATFEKFYSEESKEVQDRINMVKSWIEDFKTAERFDHVLVTEVLEHVSNPIPILAKAAECVRHDGTIYISSPSILWGNNTHVRGVPLTDLAVWLKQCGLEPIELVEIRERTFSLARLRPLRRILRRFSIR